MEFRILGPLEVLSNGHPVDLGGQKQRALLALLLLEANRVVPRDRLIDALWDESPPETARKALQVHVSQLRKVLGRDRLETADPGYRLRVDGDELDLGRFRSLEAEGRLDEALALWRGPPLADVASQRFAHADAARLAELRLACLEERADRELDAGRHAELAGELEALVAENPLRERLRAQLMLCLYRCGRQADALEAYRAGRAVLVDELGIEPGRALRDLEQAILRQDPALEAREVEPSQAQARDVQRGLFVGRNAELAELVAGFDDACAGHGRVMLLVGEPGIGKSRLAEELLAHARARDARVLVGRCWEAGGAPAYWPWVQSMRAYVREADAAELRAQLGSGGGDLAQLVPDLRRRFPDLPAPPDVEAESARFRLYDAAAEFLRAIAARRPLVLFLDDLHAADTPSLLLLQFVARELGAARLLVVGACRDVDPLPRQALTQALAELAREPGTTRLNLRGLTEADVAEYVELTDADIAAGTLYDETEGNPLFVGELVRLLAVEGELTIPQGVRDVIARRLTHLSDEANRVLVLASVLGREFDLDTLAAVAGVTPDEALDVLDEAMTARVVSSVGARLRFAHVLIRDTLYDGLTTARRVRLHRLAVEALEGQGGDIAELAHHAIAGSDFERGRRFACGAGDRANGQHAYEEAARLYAMALDALELSRPDDDAERCELLLRLGGAEMRAGDSPAARRAFLAAAGIARRTGLRRELARAAAGYGGRYMWARPGGDTLLVPLLEEGLTALGDDDDPELRARLVARLAGALRDEPDRDHRERLTREAVARARESGNVAALAYALDGRAAAIMGPDTVDEMIAIGREAYEAAVRVGDRERAANALGHLRTAEVTAGTIAQSEANLATETAIAQEMRQPAQLWQTHVSRTMFALAAGRLVEAEEGIPTALVYGERAFPPAAIPAYHLHRHALHAFRGTLEEVHDEIRDLAAAYPNRPAFGGAYAHLLAAVGRDDEAQRLLTDLLARGLPLDQEFLFGMSLLAETAARLGDAAAAAEIHAALRPWAHLNAADHPEGIRGSVARYVGLTAPTPDDAVAHFEAALAMNERMGARPWLAYTQSDYAALLAGRDDARAAALDAAARTTYDELGVVPVRLVSPSGR